MNNDKIIQDGENDLLYTLSGIYLILVGVFGGILNLVSLTKAMKVRIGSTI